MPIALTKKAEDKVKEILSEQPEPYAGREKSAYDDDALRAPA